MTKKLLAALIGTVFAVGALSGSIAFADDKKEEKTTKEEKK